jgi:VanZ family protein
VEETDSKGRRPARQRSRGRWRWLFVLLYVVTIYLGSSIPGDELPDVGVSDKVLHAVEFAGLAVLVCRALRAQVPSRPLWFVAVAGVLVSTGYGALDEAHQLMVAHRMTDVTDLLADAVGASLAAWGWGLASQRWPWLR